ncbi:MAG: hypothetical protein GXO37_08170, partial [Chloroflexi bacterium]|nr:hypothetical protein [Chloroflexota bacterium]
QTIVPAGGDSYVHNVYERPFNAGSQDRYDPDLDVTEGRLSLDDDWAYVSLVLYGLGDADHPRGAYGVELDLDRDGRGDVLVLVTGGVESTTWDAARVRVYEDADHDVGAARVCAPDAPHNGTGYERLIYAAGRGQDPDLAWARWVPGERPQVQLAFKRALLDQSPAFTWWVWAAGQIPVPAFMNYHDTLVAALAGAPYPDDPFYPVRALARFDSTCRAAYGFEPTAEDWACGVCPPEGEFPPDEHRQACPPPDSPPEVPYALCDWQQDPNGVWVCHPVDLLSVREVGLILRGEPAPPRVGGDEPPTEIRCAWNPRTCAWDCDDRCLPDMAEAEAHCQTLTPDPNAPPVISQFFCERAVPNAPLPRLDLVFWDDLACQWDGRCLFDPRPLEDFVQQREQAGFNCVAFATSAANARASLQVFGFSLQPETHPSLGQAVGAICLQDDGDLVLEPGEAWEACLVRSDTCGLECETLETETPPETNCPIALTPLESLCTGFLGRPFRAPGGLVVQCIVDDGDGQTLVPGPNGMVPDEDDTNMVFLWDDQACEWTCADCFYGPQCAQFGCPAAPSCVPPTDGPPFCDFRQELEDGRWLCTSLDATPGPSPFLCAWDPALCDWVCEPTDCRQPEGGPTAIQGDPSWECGLDPDVAGAWLCVLPQSTTPPYRCIWEDTLCAWRCAPAVCQPPTSSDQDGYCEQDAATGRWRCEGRGEFDRCEWDIEQCRWRCWDVCPVDVNGPDGCDQVIQRSNDVWTCLRGSQNLNCTFDASAQVCDWVCQLRCEIPAGPPPQCNPGAAHELGPGHWSCEDEHDNRIEWRYNLAECRWEQVAP